MANWQHIVCEACYECMYPGRVPYKLVPDENKKGNVNCCKCLKPIMVGDEIHVRMNENECFSISNHLQGR